MDTATIQFVRERAKNRCEYCRLPERFSSHRFHIEHIIARQHGGQPEGANLALACPECNFYKGTNLTGIDPDTGLLTPLFHPRKDNWGDHFSLIEADIIGQTPAGRTTAWLLEMNTGDRVRLRKLLLRLGIFD